MLSGFLTLHCQQNQICEARSSIHNALMTAIVMCINVMHCVYKRIKIPLFVISLNTNRLIFVGSSLRSGV